MKLVLFAALIGLGLRGPVRADEPTPAPPKAPTILFLGDSITQAGGYVRNIDAELTKQAPANPPRVINHGRSSETVSDLSEAYHPGRRPCLFARLDAELAQDKPDWVVACYGINDGIYHPYNDQRFAAYQAGMATLIKKVNAAGAHLVLLTPPPYANPGPPFPAGTDAAAREKLLDKANAEAEAAAEKDPNKFGYRTPYAYYDEVLARYCKWLLTLDGRDGVQVVDLRSPMLAKGKATHGGDPIHPNELGHSVMAEAFLKAWPAVQAQGK